MKEVRLASTFPRISDYIDSGGFATEMVIVTF